MRLPQSILPGILVLSFAAMPAIADVVAVISVRSPIDVLSASQVVDIFLGKAHHFPDGTPAVPIDQAENSTARDEFYLRVGKSAAQIKAYWSKIIFTGRGQPPATAPNGIEIRKRIVGNPAAIGYIDRSLVDSTVKVVF